MQSMARPGDNRAAELGFEPMDPEALATDIWMRAHVDGFAKFMVGQAEHGGDIRACNPVQNAWEEALDLVNYLAAAEWQRTRVLQLLYDIRPECNEEGRLLTDLAVDILTGDDRGLTPGPVPDLKEETDE